MARSINKVILRGNVTRDPELRTTKSGKPVYGFGTATNRAYTDDKGQRHEQAQFHNIVAWGKLAEIAGKYLNRVQFGNRSLAVPDLRRRARAHFLIVGRHNHGSQSGRGLVKGSLVYTEGRLETRKYEKDGQEKSRTEIIINQLLMLDNKAASTKDAAASTNGHTSKPSDHPDDLPDMEFSEEEASSENIPY